MAVILRPILLALAAIAAVVCASPRAGAATPSAPAQTRTVDVLMKTSMGDITIELYPDKAPLTVANFLRYVDEKRYAGARFYRTVRADNDRNPDNPINVVQGGIEYQSSLPPVAHETTQMTGLKHVDGTISMARLAPGTASSEFFICLGDNPNLDFGKQRNADGQGFAAFGRVIAGIDVVRRIHAASSNAPTDEPYVRGQVLDAPVAIRSLERVKPR